MFEFCPQTMWVGIGALAAYLLGSVNFSLIVVWFRTGRDVRSQGSGSAGATNVYRAAGPVAAITVLALDLFRAGFFGWIGRQYADACGYFAMIWPLAMLMGNFYPVFHGFRGGKGVAALIGIFCLMIPKAGFSGLLLWLLGFYLSGRRVSIASLLMVTWYPFGAWIFSGSIEMTVFAALAAVAVWLRHVPNIRRMLKGSEPAT